MKEIQGKYNSAKVFTDVVEDSAIAQIKELCDQEFVQNEKIRIIIIIICSARADTQRLCAKGR